MAREGPPLTKKDLESLATKADLKAAIEPFATKAELQAAVEPLATKAEMKEAIDAAIEPLATKIDLKKLAFALIKTNEKIDKVYDELTTKMDSGFSRVMHAIDSFARKAENYDKSSVLHGHAITETQVQLTDHERRLAVLETKQ